LDKVSNWDSTRAQERLKYLNVFFSDGCTFNAKVLFNTAECFSTPVHPPNTDMPAIKIYYHLRNILGFKTSLPVEYRADHSCLYLPPNTLP